jgi:hypothetical protein
MVCAREANLRRQEKSKLSAAFRDIANVTSSLLGYLLSKHSLSFSLDIGDDTGLAALHHL